MAFRAGDIEASLKLNRTPFTRELEKAREQARRFANRDFTATVNARTGRAERQLGKVNMNAEAASRDRTLNIKVNHRDANLALGRIEQNTARAARRSMNIWARLFLNPMGSAFLGLPGLAQVGAAGVATAVGAIPIAVGAATAAIMRDNASVERSFESLSNTVVSGMEQAATQAVPALNTSMVILESRFQSLQPQIEQTFGLAGQYIPEFADGIGDLVANTLPGLNTSMAQSSAIMSSWNSVLGDIGTGLGDLFYNATENADLAAAGIENMGTTLNVLLGFVGDLFGQFTELNGVMGGQFAATLEQALSTVDSFVNGSLVPFGTTLNVILAALEGFLNVLEPIAPALGAIAGVVLPVVAGFRLLSAVMSGFSKIRASSAITNLTTSLGSVPAAANTARTGLSRVRGAATGLLGVLGGPWGAAIGVGITALTMFAQSSQQAEADQQALRQALVQSGGEFDKTAQAALMATDEFQNMISNASDAGASLDQLGVSQGQLVTALTEGGSSMQQLRTQLQGYVSDAENVQGAIDSHNAGMTDGQARTLAMGNAARQLLEDMDGMAGSINSAAEAALAQDEALNGATTGIRNLQPGAEALTSAMDTLQSSTRSTADAVSALNTRWRQLHGQSITMQEATANFLSGLSSLREQIQGTKDDTNNWKNALFTAGGQVNLTTEAGRGLLNNLVTQGEQYRELAQTTYDTTLQQTNSQMQAETATINAVRRRRSAFISEMEQMDVNSDTARMLADQYLGVPEDILTDILLRGDDAARQDIDDIRDRLNNLDGQTAVTSVIQRFYRQIYTNQTGSPTTSWTAGNVPHRDGGEVGNIQGYATGGEIDGRGGPRTDSNLIAASDGEFVVNAHDAQQNMDLLRTINSGQFRSNTATLRRPTGNGGGGGAIVDYAKMEQAMARAIGSTLRTAGGEEITMVVNKTNRSNRRR